MGTKTADQAGAETGAGATTDEEKVDVIRTDAGDRAPETGELTDSEAAAQDAQAADETDGAEGADGTDGTEALREESADESAGVGQGAGAVVSAVLGFVSLTGSWIGTIAGARQTLVGQLEASSGASVARQIQAVYGDAWQITALWAGLFALAALVTGVVVLARPAFGSPARPQAAWIKSVSWAGIALGVIGLLLAVLKYTDALLGLPSAS
jgi:hypothetical protein